MDQNPGQSVVPSPRIAVITCAVLEEEISHFASGLDHLSGIFVVEQGLHDEPDKLRAELQAKVDEVEADEQIDAIVLGYGLCSRGVEGVKTQRCKLVITRAHDCITLLLGDKQRYADYVAEHPGTYWYSPGWNEHALMPGKQRYDKLYNRYLEKYGEDNAQFLMESEQHWFTTYNRATFVELTVGATDEDVQYTKDCAQWLGWNYDYQQGDPGLIKALLSGTWDAERFCVLGPGQTIRMTADDRVIEVADG